MYSSLKTCVARLNSSKHSCWLNSVLDLDLKSQDSTTQNTPAGLTVLALDLKLQDSTTQNTPAGLTV